MTCYLLGYSLVNSVEGVFDQGPRDDTHKLVRSRQHPLTPVRGGEEAISRVYHRPVSSTLIPLAGARTYKTSFEVNRQSR